LQHYSRRGRKRWWQSSSFCFFHYKKKKKKATTTRQCISTRGNAAVQRNVAFFATLRCSIAPQEQTLCYNTAPQEHNKEEQTKQTNEKKVKMLTWVPRGSRSGSSHSSLTPTTPSSKLWQLQAPSFGSFKLQASTAPSSCSNSPGSSSKLAPSSLPLDVFGALAMEWGGRGW
jgi:hypothetical protein